MNVETYMGALLKTYFPEIQSRDEYRNNFAHRGKNHGELRDMVDSEGSQPVTFDLAYQLMPSGLTVNDIKLQLFDRYG